MADPSQPEESRFLAKKKNRKLSWVGVDEDSPYSYLREAMVSSLMGGICDPQFFTHELNPRNLVVEEQRKRAIEKAIGAWSFSAHDFTDDELLYGNLTMLEHALKMPELEKWRMSSDELTSFLLAARAAYNDFVLYHNFRHVSDVLQAIFFFLVSIGTLPPYPEGSDPPKRETGAIAALLKPFDGLTLLISAIGHDVGHPGVNNAFLVALNAPLAQLYNDRSVLESFHCAAYSQILRRHWPQAFTDTKMRKLMIEAILATDMGLHFKYMSDLGNLQEKLAHNQRTTDGWSVKILEEYRDLACALLIKCADISNVARKFEVAAQWANILTDEFSNQGRMENRLNIPTCLFGGPPVQDDIIKLGQSQIGFMNVFARPLFDAVTDVLPAMQFSVDELIANKDRWEREIAQEKERQLQADHGHLGKAPGLLHLRGLQNARFDGAMGTPSPKSRSTEFLVPPTSDPEGKQNKSLSDPNPFASVEAQAEAKRRILNPSNYDFSDNASSDPPAVSPGTQTSTTPLTANTNPSSRRGSADPSLTAILVTQSAPGSSPTDKSKKRKDRKDKRGSADSQTAGHDLAPLNSPLGKINHMNPSGSQSASEKGVPMMPDENVGAMTDFTDAYERSDSVAVGTSVNGALIPPEMKNGDGNGAPTAAATNKLKSKSPPNAFGMADGAEDDELESQTGKSKEKKFGLGRFWKKKWRAVSGVGEKEGMKSKERIPVAAGAGGSGGGTGSDPGYVPSSTPRGGGNREPFADPARETQGRTRDGKGTAS